MNLLRSLEQERSKFAYDVVDSAKGKNFESNYSGYVKKAPAMILNNGLGNTLAFFWSKSNNEAYRRLFEHISSWLEKRGIYRKENNISNALEWITERADNLMVLQATQETLALLNWMRRFADAMLEEGEVSEG